MSFSEFSSFYVPSVKIHDQQETTLEILAGGDTPCNSLRACDTGKSYGAGTPWTNAEVTWICFFGVGFHAMWQNFS